jgi:hypothetical protein
MSGSMIVEVEMPADLKHYRFPKGLDRRLQDLLDKQDRGERLSSAERKEAEGLVELAEILSLFRLRAKQAIHRRRAKS